MKNIHVALTMFLLLIAQVNCKAQFTLNDSLRNLLVKNKGFSEVHFVGNGDIQVGYQSAKKEIEANTGLGILFWRVWEKNWEFQLDAKINVASTVDTIMLQETNNIIADNRLYGRSILTPGFARQSTYVQALWYHRKPIDGKGLFYYISGLEIRLVASNNVWGYYNTANNVRNEKIIDVSNLGLRVGVFHEFLPDGDRLKGGTSIRFGINAIARGIQGDLGRKTPDIRELRRKLLGATNTVFAGFEPSLSFRLKNIRAEASLPYLFADSSQTIPGLTGAQFITSIGFVGGFPIRLN